MTKEQNYCVYCHTLPNGEVYYGITKSVKNRWYPSLYKQTSLGSYIDKFGWKNIKHEVLYSGLTRDEALMIEYELIQNGWDNNTCINVNRSGHYQQTDSYKDDQRTWHNAWLESNRDKWNAYMREYYKRKKGGGDKPEPLF